MIKRLSISCVLAATLAFVIGTQVPDGAQSVTNFAGKWVFVPEKSEGTPTVPRIFNTTGAPAKSKELVIKQTPEALSVNIGEVNLKYKLDGTASNISAEGRAGFPVGKAAWEGDKLVATMTQEVFSAAKADYLKVPLKEVFSLSNDVLTIERTRTHIDGKTDTQKLVYTRVLP
jgi:hypothetical protein